MKSKDFDFDVALDQALAAIDVGLHCSCAEIVAEVLRVAIPLESTAVRHAAAGFGGGVVGSGSLCGAFSAGLCALGLAHAERENPRGCITEPIAALVHCFHDEWKQEHGSLYCADLTGYPSMREESAREEFWAGSGPQKCTQVYMRFAVEKILDLVAEEDAVHQQPVGK